MKPRRPPSPDKTVSDLFAVSRRKRARARNAMAVLVAGKYREVEVSDGSRSTLQGKFRRVSGSGDVRSVIEKGEMHRKDRISNLIAETFIGLLIQFRMK